MLMSCWLVLNREVFRSGHGSAHKATSSCITTMTSSPIISVLQHKEIVYTPLGYYNFFFSEATTWLRNARVELYHCICNLSDATILVLVLSVHQNCQLPVQDWSQACFSSIDMSWYGLLCHAKCCVVRWSNSSRRFCWGTLSTSKVLYHICIFYEFQDTIWCYYLTRRWHSPYISPHMV